MIAGLPTTSFAIQSGLSEINMMTIVLWDREKYAEIARVTPFEKNDDFLIKNDEIRYPLLSDLADCAEDIHCNDSLLLLLQELTSLKNELMLEEEIVHVDEIICLTHRAIKEQMCVLFSPFGKIL